MFRLEEELRRWRERLEKASALGRSDVDELEQHARDSIDDLRSRGLSDEEALLVATRRVGRPAELGDEFEKVNRGRVLTQRVFWVLAGYLFFEGFKAVTAAVVTVTQLGVATAGAGGGAMGITSVVVQALMWAEVGLLVWLLTSRSRTGLRTNLFEARPRWFTGTALASIAVGCLVVSTIVRFGGQVVLVRTASVEDFGESILYSTYGGLLISLLAPLGCLAALIVIGRRIDGPRHADA